MKDRILSIPSTGHIEIFFDNTLYDINPEKVSDIAMDSILEADADYYDLNNLEYGVIVCHYNPTRVDLQTAQLGCKRIIEYIESCHPAANGG